MLSIHVKDDQLDLPDDFSVSLALSSPIFNAIGDYSFPFKIPSTWRNKAILGWKNRVASTRSVYETYDGSMRWNGMVMYRGTIRVTIADDSSYEGTLIFDKGNFNYDVKDLMLNQFDYGMMNFANEADALTYFNWTLNHFYPDAPFAMPQIQNATFFDPPSVDLEQLTYNRYYPDKLLHAKTTLGNRTLLVPCFYLKFVLNKLAEIMGYRLQDDFFTSKTQLSRLVIYNSVDVNEVIFGLQQFYFFRNIPNVKVADFLSGLETWFNCSFHVDGVNKILRIVGNRDVLFNSEVVEFSKNILTVSNQMTDQDQTMDRVLGYQLSKSPDQGDKFYKTRLDLEQPLLDNVRGCVQYKSDIPWPPYAWLGDIYYVTSEDIWYQAGVNMYYMMAWLPLANGPSLMDKFVYRWGTDNNKIDTIFSTLADPYGEVQCGNLGTDNKKDTPRLFWVAWVGGYTIPLSLSGLNDDSIFSIRYDGSIGMIKNFWKDWLDWKIDKTKYVWIEKQMDPIELLNFDFTKRYCMNGINYLVSEIAVTFNKLSITSAQLKCFTA